MKEQGHLGKDDQKKPPQSSLPGDQRFRNLRLLDLNDAESESLQDPSSSPPPPPPQKSLMVKEKSLSKYLTTQRLMQNLKGGRLELMQASKEPFLRIDHMPDAEL